MTDLIPTSQAARMLRSALHAAFPGVRFSVRKDRGTASAWLRVTYTDGPRVDPVQEICHRYAGQQFNAHDDGYDQRPPSLVQFDGEALPRVVQFLVDGVIVQREMGAAGRAGVAARVAALAPGLVGIDAAGDLTTEALTPEQAATLAGAHYAYGPANVRDVARAVFSTLDLTPA